jgi:hypothetical protein
MNLEVCRGLIFSGKHTPLVEPFNCKTDSIDTARRRGQCTRDFVHCWSSIITAAEPVACVKNEKPNVEKQWKVFFSPLSSIMR